MGCCSLGLIGGLRREAIGNHLQGRIASGCACKRQTVLLSPPAGSLCSMPGVKHSIFFITGTDTGVGKTVLAVLLTRYLRNAGLAVAALKPVCSGDRKDARLLSTALAGTLALEEINPWHFRAPLAPVLAARRENRELKLADVLAHVRRIQKRFQTVVVEGAGGLLSPLGEKFDSRDLILLLKATPIVVCPNRLGAVNQSLLVLAALPPRYSRRAQIVLISPERPDSAGRSNPQLLAEKLGAARVHVLPWLARPDQSGRALAVRRARGTICALVAAIGLQFRKQRA
jgi:dethiobiotin synthetase